MNNIIGQDNLIDKINKFIKNDNVRHSYIISGEKGTGKTLAAMYFSKSLLCINYKGNPCEECSSCIGIHNGNNPDFKIINAEKGNISIKTIREEIVSDVDVKPYKSKYKIYIIEDAHKMNIPSQNALLKTIEEPPKYVVIFLITDNENALLDTIKSRCLNLKTKSMTREDIEKYLDEKNITLEGISVDYFKNLSDLEKYISDDVYRELKEKTIQLVINIKNRNMADIFEYEDFFIDNKENINMLIDIMYFWFRDLLIIKNLNNDKFLINKDKINELNIEKNSYTYDKIISVIETIEKMKIYLKSNVNYKLLIQNVLLDIKGD